MRDSALLNYKGKMLGRVIGEGHLRLLQWLKADGKWPNLGRNNGQVETSSLRFFSELILMNEESGERRKGKK